MRGRSVKSVCRISFPARCARSETLASSWARPRRILLQHAPNHADAHGHGRDGLRRSVMQISSQLLPGLLVDLHHAFLLLHQVLIQPGILHGDGRLTRNDVQDVPPNRT